MNIEIGTEHTVQTVVSENNTAIAMKSGSLPVFATPSMAALMEQAASELCEKSAEENETTVGTAISVKHISATAIGVSVTAKATVTEVDGRKISFLVEAYDDKGVIGKGTHERFVVFADRFMEKVSR